MKRELVRAVGGDAIRRCRSAALIAGALAACQSGQDRPSAPGSARVVSLHDVTTEIMIALGAVDRLAGIAEPVDLAPGNLRALERVPRVGAFETIAAVRPDVVLGLDVVAEQAPDLVDALRRSGVTVELADPTRVADIPSLVRKVGALAGVAPRAGALAADLESRLATRPPGIDRAPLRVFVYDCCDPPFTAGKRTVLSELIARAGGTNIFADVDKDWTHVSWEEVVARRPELIVIHAYKYEGQGDVPDKEKALRAIPSLEHVPTAVMPLRCSLGGLGSVEGLERLRAAIAGGDRG